MNSYYVYIMSNEPFGTIYIGVTNDINRRVYEHKQGIGSKFVDKYKLHRLVFLEECGDVLAARQRERNLKHWNRDWKLKLITDLNPDWKDLYDGSSDQARGKQRMNDA